MLRVAALELLVGASGVAVSLVAVVRTVVLAVTAHHVSDATPVLALELSFRAWPGLAVLLI